MFLLYIDESGVAERDASQTSHFVMVGMAVHVGTWFALTQRVRALKSRYTLIRDTQNLDLELHAAWVLRAYHEQSLIPGFDQLSQNARYDAIVQWREEQTIKAWPGMEKRKVAAEKKYFKRTIQYAHLTRKERVELYDKALRLVADHRRGITLFGEAINKQRLPSAVNAADEAFSRLVRKFEFFLLEHEENPWGMLVVDNDEAKRARYTEMLQRFQRQATGTGGVDRVIEAPFFLDSRANSGVQVVDLCAYALRRYMENQEVDKFKIIFPKFYRKAGGLAGLSHFTAEGCNCLICAEPPPGPRSWRRRRRSTRRRPA